MNISDSVTFLHPYVRFFNATGAEHFDFYCCNTLAAAGLPSGSFSPYCKIAAGKQIFRLFKSGNKKDIQAQITLNSDIGSIFTLCAIKSSSGITLHAVSEPCIRESLQYGHIRICNLLSENCRTNVYADNECIAADIRYTEISKYIAILPGKYRLQIKNSDDLSDIYVFSSQLIKPGKYNTLYIIENSTGPEKQQGIFTIDAASYNGFYL